MSEPLQLTLGFRILAEGALKYLKVKRIDLTTFAAGCWRPWGAGFAHQSLRHWWRRQPPHPQICDCEEGGNRRMFNLICEDQSMSGSITTAKFCHFMSMIIIDCVYFGLWEDNPPFLSIFVHFCKEGTVNIIIRINYSEDERIKNRFCIKIWYFSEAIFLSETFTPLFILTLPLVHFYVLQDETAGEPCRLFFLP